MDQRTDQTTLGRLAEGGKQCGVKASETLCHVDSMMLLETGLTGTPRATRAFGAVRFLQSGHGECLAKGLVRNKELL